MPTPSPQPSPQRGASVLRGRGRFDPPGLHAPFSVLQRTSVRRDASELAACIDVAMRRRPADLVIKGARLFNLATGELERADLAICGERIAAVEADLSRGIPPEEIEAFMATLQKLKQNLL